MVIVNWCIDGPRFWTGKKWVEEYPDATKYNLRTGRAELKRLGGPAQLVANYGFVTEYVAFKN